MQHETLVFAGLVFLTVFLLMAGLSMPVFGENRQAKRRLRAKALTLSEGDEKSALAIELRKDEFKGMSGWQKAIETLPMLAGLRQTIAQSGNTIPAYRLVLMAALLGPCAALIAWSISPMPLLALPAGLVFAALPFVKISFDRGQRLAKFEEQLPEAIDVMKRALQAGHPFAESLDLVAKELDEPISSEFGKTFADLNYGNDAKRALLGLLSRVPSVNVMAMVTSVLVQRETGGNLAEVLAKLSSVIRARFKFHRKVRTLSAEGRLSAWILCLVPFALVALLSFTTPDYLPILFEHPTGHKLLIGSAVGMFVGIFWIRNIIRIEV